MFLVKGAKIDIHWVDKPINKNAILKHSPDEDDTLWYFILENGFEMAINVRSTNFSCFVEVKEKGGA